MKKINEKLNMVYNFTINYINENGFPPSVREICNKLHIKSTATAFSYIEKLKDKGLIEKHTQKKRAITLSGKSNVKKVPLVGVVNAGSPIFAVENLEGYYPFPDDFGNNDNCFALKVNGNSMINAGINENDVIIVSQQNTANNGEIVVALVDDSATVKRFFKRKDKVILHPENDDMSDMVFDNVVILGVVKGLYRKF